MVNDKVSVKTYGKNFEYLKFGELSVGTSNSVFLQGERTATTGEKAVPTTGKAKYLGNWVGYITGADSSKGFNDAKDVADFDIDFASKTVNGKLITKDRKDPVFNITGQIAGNGWTGKASTAEANAGGYKIDSSSTGKSIVIKDAKVTGAFMVQMQPRWVGHLHTKTAVMMAKSLWSLAQKNNKKLSSNLNTMFVWLMGWILNQT